MRFVEMGDGVAVEYEVGDWRIWAGGVWESCDPIEGLIGNIPSREFHQ
jgi:hypothetical protein